MVWNLAWVAHALSTDPRHLVGANINYPAPAQLTGIEHHLSTQLLFAPVFWTTDNAVLAANVTALASYPLAALAMERLLLALGCSAGPAWVLGLVFALGPDRVPGSIFVLKQPNLYLPLVALALTRLRDRPVPCRAAALCLVVTLALFSSYYLAVMALVAGGLWGVLELLRGGPGRARFAVLALGATGVACALLVVFSLPWYARPELAHVRLPSATMHGWVAAWHTVSSGRLALTLAALGVIGLAARAGAARRAAVSGLVVTFAAQILMRGPGDGPIPLPFAAIAASPLRFFRYAYRFVTVLGLGTALLGAAALETVRGWAGRFVGGLAVAAVAALLLWTRGPRLSDTCRQEFPAQSHPIYQAVRDAAAREGAGPLLELPVLRVLGDPAALGTEVQAMVGSTRHWQPLVTGYLEYLPPHRGVLDVTIARLPASDALDDIADMTHVRWLLLRPTADWPMGLSPTRPALPGLAGVRPIADVDGWQLFRVERAPRHPEWFAAIAAGVRPGLTVLGTPLTPIPEAAATAVLSLAAPTDGVQVSSLLHLDLRVANTGSAPWPVAVPPGAPPAHTVRLMARWWSGTEARGTPAATQDVGLRRDVPAGETLAQDVFLATPPEAGAYLLEVTVQQVDGARFDGEGSRPLRLPVERIGAPAVGPRPAL